MGGGLAHIAEAGDVGRDHAKARVQSRDANVRGPDRQLRGKALLLDLDLVVHALDVFNGTGQLLGSRLRFRIVDEA